MPSTPPCGRRRSRHTANVIALDARDAVVLRQTLVDDEEVAVEKAGQRKVLSQHLWEHTVGSLPRSAPTPPDSRAQLERCRRELGFQRLRVHGLLCDDVALLNPRDCAGLRMSMREVLADKAQESDSSQT